MRIIDFGIGQTEEKFFPIDDMRKVSSRVLIDSNKDNFQYAPSEGLELLRHELAAYLGRKTGKIVKAANLLITAGASHAIELVLKKLVPAGSVVLVEDPTYSFALNIFDDWSVVLKPVPLEEDGINIEKLEELVIKYKVKLLYTIPIHQNPTGITMSEEKRKKLKALAILHDFIVASDEVYQFVGEKPFCGLFTKDEKNIISIGSFSKILGPGVRIGWVHADIDMISRLTGCGVFSSGGGISPIMSLIVSQLLISGIQDSILFRLNKAYRERMALMSSILSSQLNPDIIFNPPGGGFFSWLHLPKGVDLIFARKKCQENGVDFKTGEEFSCVGNFQHCIRLAFTYYNEDEIISGSSLICSVLNKVILNYSATSQ